MADRFPRLPVAKVATPVLGGTPSRSVSHYWGGRIKWAAAKDVVNAGGRYIHVTAECITKDGLDNSAAKVLPKGTVVMTARGTVGALAQLGEDMTFNQTCYALVPKDSIMSDFLYYALRYSIAAMRSLSYGTVFDTITTKTFDYLPIPVPPLPEQRAIAAILGALDDKIELNRRMNETLEAMAQALFKSWFVDFEPFRDQGMQDSPLGPIPRGWRVGKLKQVLELRYGKGLKEEERQPGKIPVYGSNGQVGWHNESLAKGPGIVVGRKGNPGIVTWVPCDFFPIDTTFFVVPVGPISAMFYLFHSLKLLDLPSLGADSAVPGLNRNMAYMSDIIVPPSSTLQDFDTRTKPWRDKSHANDQESITIAAIRDALLPKLLSGGMRVKDAEKFVEKNV